MSIPRFQLVPGGRLVHQPAAGGVGWRLLGANNRELGRAVTAFPDAETAVAAIEAIRVVATGGASRIRYDPGTRLWWWQLCEGSADVVAASGRGFRHEGACRHNLDQFREIAPAAAVLEA